MQDVKHEVTRQDVLEITASYVKLPKPHVETNTRNMHVHTD